MNIERLKKFNIKDNTQDDYRLPSSIDEIFEMEDVKRYQTV